MAESMELFGALLRGELPERVPVVCNMLDQGAREMGMSLEEYYSRGEHVAEGQLKLLARYGHDVVWAAPYVARDSEMLGSRLTVFAENGPPNVGDLVIRELKDIETLEIPEDFSAVPGFAEQVTTIRLLKEAVGGRVPVLSCVIGSFSMPAILMGIEKWLELLFMGPPELRDMLLEKCSLFCRRKIMALREAGTDMIAYANGVATDAFLNPSQFEQLAVSWINSDVKDTGTQDLVYFNAGGPINGTVPSILERTEFRALYISPEDSVEKAREMTKGKALLAAAINDIMLISWSRKEIEDETRRIMEAGAEGGGFIFGTLLMPCMIPEDSIKILIEAAHRYGTY